MEYTDLQSKVISAVAAAGAHVRASKLVFDSTIALWGSLRVAQNLASVAARALTGALEDFIEEGDLMSTLTPSISKKDILASNQLFALCSVQHVAGMTGLEGSGVLAGVDILHEPNIASRQTLRCQRKRKERIAE